MTTIILKDGKLHADRRKVVNYYGGQMLGIRSEQKIVTLPYCHYAIAGFEFNGEDALESEFLDYLNILFSLQHIRSRANAHTPIGRALRKAKLLSKFSVIVNVFKEDLCNFLGKIGATVVAINHHTAIIAGEASETRGSIIPVKRETIVIGSARNFSLILIENDCPINEIYPAIRDSQAPTGKEYDVVSGETLDTNLFPGINEDMLMCILANCGKYLKEDKTTTPATVASFAKEVCLGLTLLTAMGKVNKKTKKFVFNQENINNNFKDCGVESKDFISYHKVFMKVIEK